MSKEFDAADFTFPTVTGANVVRVTAYVRRPWWQRRLSWLVREWRYRRPIVLEDNE